ncbi:MAG: flagellar export protein FliJ [Candidatus Marinimicrobia bacterium]|nr:flagellar export protein FliJ [Candidatus Neomarinimicrobiota bacterium]
MTKAFNFSLQKVLDIRGIVEDAKAADLQKAQAETELEKQRLTLVQTEKENLVNSSDEAAHTGSVTIGELSNRTAYVDQLSDKIKEHDEAVATSELKTDEQRQLYIKASKDKMVMEKLKEHHHDAFKKKNNQDQVKEESEIAARTIQNEEDA